MSIEGDYAKDFEHVDACSKPPTGWYCTRAAGHDGPCAAHPQKKCLNPQSHRAECECGILQSMSLVTDQPPPKDSGGVDCWLLVLEDMEKRRQDGKAKYGQPVMPFNGRDALVDAYQECLDMAVYLRQAIEERKNASS